MSLLEGHADVVMDDVGPQVVAEGRRDPGAFNARRERRGGVDRLLRRLLGLEAKMRQYRDGAASSGPSSSGSGMRRLQRRVDLARRRCRPAAEIADPGAWVAPASTADAMRVRSWPRCPTPPSPPAARACVEPWPTCRRRPRRWSRC